MSSRRIFIKQAGLFSAGVMLWPSISTGCTMAKSNIGLQLYTLRDLIPNDVSGIIAKVAAAGYKEVETFDYSIKNGFWGLKPAAFSKLLDENGLTATSGHYDMTMLLKDGNMDDLKAYIEAVKTIKSPYLTVPWIDEAFRKNADDYKRNAERFNKAGELCKTAGIQLGYHNHNFEFQKQGDRIGYELLLQETDPALVAFEMDLYWVVRAGSDPVSLFKKHPGRFPMWHVKDMSKTNKDENTEVGNGSIDFKQIFKNRELAGLKHIFVEQENNYQPDEPGSIRESAAYIKRELI